MAKGGLVIMALGKNERETPPRRRSGSIEAAASCCTAPLAKHRVPATKAVPGKIAHVSQHLADVEFLYFIANNGCSGVTIAIVAGLRSTG